VRSSQKVPFDILYVSFYSLTLEAHNLISLDGCLGLIWFLSTKFLIYQVKWHASNISIDRACLENAECVVFLEQSLAHLLELQVQMKTTYNTIFLFIVC